MEEIHLDYLKDTDGNYIIKNKTTADEANFDTYVKEIGSYSENLLISRKYFEKKLKHKIDEIVKEIENSSMVKHKVTEKDLISERFILNLKSEEEFNPIFKTMCDQEIKEYTKYSKKVRIEINFEIHIKPKQHLLFNGLINSLMNFIR